MSSILERPNLNKIFLIYGNLDDMFISPDLQKNNFRPYLNAYLKSLGYQKIVFYSGAKNTGKYVLDDESAVLAINRNKRQGTVSENPDKPKRRILSPKARQSEEQKNEVKEDVQKSAENVQAHHNRQPGINDPQIVFRSRDPQIVGIHIICIRFIGNEEGCQGKAASQIQRPMEPGV